MSPRIYLQGYWTPSAGLVLIIDFPSPVDPAVTDDEPVIVEVGCFFLLRKFIGVSRLALLQATIYWM